jgi:hypothetical protein
MLISVLVIFVYIAVIAVAVIKLPLFQTKPALVPFEDIAVVVLVK